MMKNSLICLDFDGVLCNSVLECFVSSWIGYYKNYEKESRDRVELKELRLFRSYRPFIRSGEDYMMLHYCIENGIEPKNQNEFDQHLQKMEPGTLEEFRTIFYSVRQNLLATEKQWWLSLNPVFDFLRVLLHQFAANEHFHVVSTKEVYYINRILTFNGVTWPEDRLHCTGKTPKIPYIRELLTSRKKDGALFIDDQIDHFTDRDPRIMSHLAGWGYVKEEWLESKEISVLYPSDFVRLMGELLSK